MAKIERRWMAHYINAGTSESPQYVRLGKDLEEFSPEMAAKVEKTSNILGETRVAITGYEKSGTVEPYFAEKGDALFDRLQKIVDEQLVLDDLKTEMLEVHMWEAESSGAFPAIKQDAHIEVTSYGGDTNGYQIPFTVHYTGQPVKGKFDPAKNTFTPDLLA